MMIWNEIIKKIEEEREVALLYVIAHSGSSPGRQGFSMAVSEKIMTGSIGGGFMEQKLVELAKSLLHKKTQPFIMRQVHRKDIPTHQSGMICSGEQTVAFYFLKKNDVTWIRQLISLLEGGKPGTLLLNESGIELSQENETEPVHVIIESEKQWTYRERLDFKNRIYIVGGGHVGLALSETMAGLGFYVVQLDDRQNLNTMEENPYAHKKLVIDYDQVDEYIPEGEEIYVALVSFGYRTDKAILKKLLGKKFRYLGMIGSEEKVRVLFDELEKEGYDRKELEKINAPIGITPHSKTPREIAVSIAAQVIHVKNQ